jgi:hypothetical protein
MYFDPAENTVHIVRWLVAWLLVAGGLTALVLIVSFLNLLLTRGIRGIQQYFSEIAAIIGDLISLSPRRIWALTRLTFLEAYRRKALAVFVVFGLIFMFASWFMGDRNAMTPDQVKVNISFVLTAISWLTLPVVLILCCFGIPEDIRLRSIHTVVTKPARRLEIVLGRMIGISLIGCVVLGFMSIVGYFWIVRQVPSSLQPMLVCRVPVYGHIRFLDRDGQPANSGINVGDIWAFRSYIEGATKARAQWKFPRMSEAMLDADGNLNLENTFSAFRSYKGDMTRQLFYDIRIFNEDTKLSYTTDPQSVIENRKKLDKISRKLTTPDGVQHDLIKDFVSNDGALYLEVSCVDREQYIGMARSDLYVRMPDRQFIAGYSKAVLGIALTVILISMLGVCASTIVKGPIATMVTFVLFLLSGKRTHEFMDELVSGRFQGGGPLESIYRLVTHMGPTTELPDNPAFKIFKIIDMGAVNFLWLCKQIIPRLQSFNMTEFVANGFDVPYDVSILPSMLVTTAFFLPCVLLGYFALRVRELESK